MIKKLAVILLSASLSTSVLAEQKTQADFDVYVAALKKENPPLEEGLISNSIVVFSKT